MFWSCSSPIMSWEHGRLLTHFWLLISRAFSQLLSFHNLVCRLIGATECWDIVDVRLWSWLCRCFILSPHIASLFNQIVSSDAVLSLGWLNVLYRSWGISVSQIDMNILWYRFYMNGLILFLFWNNTGVENQVRHALIFWVKITSQYFIIDWLCKIFQSRDTVSISVQGDPASNPNLVYNFLNKPRKIVTELENNIFDKQGFFTNCKHFSYSKKSHIGFEW